MGNTGSPSLSKPVPAVLLVPDTGLYLTLRLPRIFHEAGVATDLLCLHGHPLARSRYVRRVQFAPSWAEIERQVVDRLRQPENLWQKIIVVHEPSVRRLLATLDSAALKLWQPGAMAPLTREFFAGKFGLLAAARQWGLPIPASRLCLDMDEIRAFGAEAGWPIIVKPPNQLGGHGLQKFCHEREVDAAGKSLNLPLLAQKFIVGRRVVLDLFCSGGRLLAWLASYSIAQARGPLSYSTGRLHCAMPGLVSLVEKIAGYSHFEGFCGIDCLEEAASGQFFLLEFNPRVTSGWRFSRHCGVDISSMVKSWVGGQPMTSTAVTSPPGLEVQAHYFSADLFRCIRQVDWRGLSHWLPGSSSSHDIYWDDPGVLWAAMSKCCKGAFIRKCR